MAVGKSSEKLLSVLIPTLNEAAYLEATIACVRARAADPSAIEIVVADCGSTDGTTEIAQAAGAILASCDSTPEGPCNRAEALNLAAACATGDHFLFLHADSQVPEHFDALIAQALAGDVMGGAFEFELEGNEFGLRMVELINRVRYRVWPLYYGDQGIFIHRLGFIASQGYPNSGIMEDADFCRRLLRLGRLQRLPQRMVTSARRFREGGTYRVLGHDVWLFFRDLVGLTNARYSKAYQANNVARGNE